jgi:hypothetical protein
MASPSSGGSGDREAGSSADHCEVCDLELVTIRMIVDGNELVMQSCQKCDTRRWHLAGRPVDLERALAEVGEHAGRRR